jgi:hypothetical protein
VSPRTRADDSRPAPFLDRDPCGSLAMCAGIALPPARRRRDARRAIAPDPFLLKRRWMKQFPFRIVHARRHLLKPNSGDMKQVFAAAALEAVLAAAQRPPGDEDSRIDSRSSSLGGLRRSFVTVLATMVLVALGAASSAAQSSASSPVPAGAIARPDPRRCPSSAAASVRLPEGIQVADDLRPRLHEMLEKSATFRSQCRRIGESRQLYVRVRLDARISGRTYRAVTRICRQPSGAVVAAIDIAAYGDPTEWVAHEFEHLIEQLDGVDLHDLERRGQGAWKSGNQMFETERAISVGRRVSREMRERLDARLAGPAAAPPADAGPGVR